MQNIELKLCKPYQREPVPNLPYKVEFSAEFSDMTQALNFMRALNEQIIEYTDSSPSILDCDTNIIMKKISNEFVARENR